MNVRQDLASISTLVVDAFSQSAKLVQNEVELAKAELAEKAGVNHFTVSKLEQDITVPTWPTVRSLAKALGASCADFEDTVDPPAERPKGRSSGRPRKQPETAPPAPEPEPEPEPEKPTRKPRRKKEE